MAHSIPISDICDTKGCVTIASYIVYSSRYGRRGNHCSKHTTQQVEMLNRFEEQDSRDEDGHAAAQHHTDRQAALEDLVHCNYHLQVLKPKTLETLKEIRDSFTVKRAS